VPPSHACGTAVSMVAVAQLVESRIVIPVVVGSNPISHPKIQRLRARFRLPGVEDVEDGAAQMALCVGLAVAFLFD
jgi:hypothetical protein